MVTIRTIENIKLGSKVTLINGVYAVLLGLFYLSFTEFIKKANFRAIDLVYQIFDKYNPEVSTLFSNILRLQGILILTLGAVIVYLSLYLLRKKDKAAWWILSPVGVIFWLGIFAIELLNKNVYTITLSLIGLITFIIGTIIPRKYYAGSSTDEF